MLKFSEDDGDGLDAVFHALSDPRRRAIITRLCEGPASVSVLAAPLGVSLPAVVQHLAVLEDASLITTSKVGRVRTCTLAPTALRFAESWLSARRLPQERQLDRLEAFLALPDSPHPPTRKEGPS
ncbi:metalloregulator ArsR/SmtB family transcription factor [Sinomonas sp. JGH33]|uniref:Metalloregulator ArsR/SmtB family transcription factor n=1 Tax=Sinomonas terricola TaxID=3110330 RepID=A0ABU5T3V1_9MICC|nr:metalloregulator ArsR/SmtB family transcription factor [Sinomonas sp. JGH33]MEA5454227.1 metalloregulator ArsR/SmtB family transcription factor [Sinomonas sp. JGH33]